MVEPITLEALILIFAGATVVLAVSVVWNSLVVRDPMAARIKNLSERRKALKANALRPQRRRDDRKRKGLSLANFVVSKLNLNKDRNDEGQLRRQLMRAGFRSRDAAVAFMFARIACPVLFGAGTVLLLALTRAYGLPLVAILLLGIVMALVGLVAPSIYIKNKAIRRSQAMQKALPDALDLLVICAEAGLGLDSAIARVSREIGRSAPEMAEELGLLSIELNFLPERHTAFENFVERNDLDEIRSIVSTLTQAEKYGTPLAQALRVLSAEFRTARLLRAEEKAARLPATLTLPMVLFILPCLFVVLIGPGILRMIDALSNL